MRLAQRAFGVLVVSLLLVVGLIAGEALAGKPQRGGSIGLVLLDSTDGVPHYGQRVTFDVSTAASDQPYVKLKCFQGGASVYSASAGFYSGYPWPWNQTFTLSSRAWIGGAADCTATLYYWDGRRTRDLTSMSFHVFP